VKLESLLWYISITVIALISIYAFYGYFSGQITGFGALAVILVTYAAFGFLMGVSVYLAAQRRGGWSPKEVRETEEAARGPRSHRRESVILEGYRPGRMAYGPYKKVLLALAAVGFLVILVKPILGLMMILLTVLPYIVLHAVEVFEAED